MRTSVFTVVMGEYDVESVVRELAALGYDGVEWRVHPDFHIHPDELVARSGELARLTRRAGLEMPSLGTYVRVDQPEGLESACHAAAEMGCPHVRIALSADYDGGTGFEEAFAAARLDLGSVEPILRRYRVRGLLELHHGSIIESASGACRLLRGLSPEIYGVIFDPANMIIAGRESWEMAVDMLGVYLARVHVKNISWAIDADGRWQWQYDTLEHGMVDWQEVIRALASAGYAGYLSLEDLYGTDLATTGFAGEVIGGQAQGGRSTHAKLEQDLAFLKRCLGDT